MSSIDKKFDKILKSISNMTDEQIESINNELKEKENRRNLILKKAKNKDFDLNKMFTDTINVLGSISTEDIIYLYEDKYKHLYPSEEFMHQELEAICKYINDIYLRYNNELFRYFYTQGQGTSEGFTKGGLNKKVKYYLNLNTDTIERI